MSEPKIRLIASLPKKALKVDNDLESTVKILVPAIYLSEALKILMFAGKTFRMEIYDEDEKTS